MYIFSKIYLDFYAKCSSDTKKYWEASKIKCLVSHK